MDNLMIILIAIFIITTFNFFMLLGFYGGLLEEVQRALKLSNTVRNRTEKGHEVIIKNVRRSQ